MHARSSACRMGCRQHTISAKFVLPLPKTQPAAYTARNTIGKGKTVLAMFPDTTTFYQATVCESPKDQVGHDAACSPSPAQPKQLPLSSPRRPEVTRSPLQLSRATQGASLLCTLVSCVDSQRARSPNTRCSLRATI